MKLESSPNHIRVSKEDILALISEQRDDIFIALVFDAFLIVDSKSSPVTKSKISI